jgi:hypothetical protein
VTRTPDRRIRNPLLYPAELRALFVCKTDENTGTNTLQNLILHKSGRYYARAFAGGKEVWKSLKTSHFSVAGAKLAEFLKEHRKGNRKQPSGGSHYSMAPTWSPDALAVGALCYGEPNAISNAIG